MCVPQVALLVKPTLGTVTGLSHMQKERLQFTHVRAKTGVERATSLGGRLLHCRAEAS